MFDDIVYFFYLTNKRDIPVEEIVWESNERCNQENLIAQLKSGVHALETPLDNLLSNWAYMVMASLAWSLKAWFGLVLTEKGRWASKHKAEKLSRYPDGVQDVRQRVYPRPRPDYPPGKKNHLPPARVESLATGFSSRL